MVNELLERIGGFFEKEFLFGALVPTLVLLMWLVFAFTVVIGHEAAFTWYDELTVSQQSAIMAMTAIVTIVLAYVLSALRSIILMLWSGRIDTWPLRPLLDLLRSKQEKRFEELRAEANKPLLWDGIECQFRDDVRPHWSESKPSIPSDELHRLNEQLADLDDTREREAMEHKIGVAVEAFRNYSGESLTNIYNSVLETLKEFEQSEKFKKNSSAARLYTEFSGDSSIQPTRLGNVVESYNAYPYRCYRIEGSVLWPRLQHVVAAPFLEKIQERRLLLDFALTSATLSVVAALASLFGGPWIWLELRLWLPVALAQMLIGYLFYLVAVQAAAGFGSLMRASCDLFRIDLLKQLGRPHPNSLEAERKRWREIMQLALYGDVDSEFLLSPRGGETPTTED